MLTVHSKAVLTLSQNENELHSLSSNYCTAKCKYYYPTSLSNIANNALSDKCL